jgi:hypothetical protein
MKWKLSLSILLIISLFMLGACTSKEKVSKDESNEAKKEVGLEEKEVPEAPEFKYVYPLTGIPTNDEINHRPVAVMINNLRPARPQSGVYQADIVYELLAEGRITRFLAVFHSEMPEKIGPVRSARPYYIELSQGLNALYIAHGYSPQALEILNSGVIDHLNGIRYDGILFKRDNSRVAPHNSYISYENVLKGAKENNFEMQKDVTPLPFLTEKEVEAITGDPATEVGVRYGENNFVSFKYNEANKTYLRYSDGEQSVDRETESPIEVKNIFIVEASHRFIDNYPRRGIDLESGGKALLIQNGVVQHVNWKNENGQIVPYLDGKKVAFVPGKTWVNVIPKDEGIERDVTIQ